MGSDSDYPVMSETGKTLDKFGIGYEIEIVSAHRILAFGPRHPSVIGKYALQPGHSGKSGRVCR